MKMKIWSLILPVLMLGTIAGAAGNPTPAVNAANMGSSPRPQTTKAVANKLYGKISAEEQQRLFSLYEQNPAAYFDEIRKVTAKLRKKDQELNAKAVQTAIRYRKSDKPEEKKKLLAELTDLTRQQLQVRMEETGRRLQEAENRLRQIRRIYETRKKNAGDIVSRRVEDLIREPGLKW